MWCDGEWFCGVVTSPLPIMAYSDTVPLGDTEPDRDEGKLILKAIYLEVQLHLIDAWSGSHWFRGR